MKFAVWSEGYRATGDESSAQFHGEAEAASFEDACYALLGDRIDKHRYMGCLAIWGCRLFDNETDARRTYG